MLVIDDDGATRHDTEMMFEVRGWGVRTAPDLRSAIEAAMTQQPHVIVTELLLPDVQSLQFARALRSVVEHDVQIVALTRASADVFAQARSEGFDLALAKPLDGDDIERYVRATTRMPTLRRDR